MTEEDQKILKEAYKRAYDYDPTDEEVDAKYSEDFKKWEEEFINQK